MRTYQYPLEWLPWPLAFFVVGLPMAGEELVFRAAGISLLLPMGVGTAVTISTILFMVGQTAHLPSWYQAIGPICGAFVLGIVHGLLFAYNQNLFQLQVAHLVFFMVITFGRKPSEQTAGVSDVAVQWF
jgi:membrane protease YdiL (CAAX protease family)